MKEWAVIIGHLCAQTSGKNPEYYQEYKRFMSERADRIKSAMGEHFKSEMVEGTTTLGGFWVPDEFSQDLILLVKEDSKALQECNTSIKLNTDSLKIGSETGGLSCYIVGEGVDITASNFSTGEVTLTPKKFACLTDQVSNELLMDSRYDILSYLGNEMKYRISQKLDSEVISGADTTWGTNIGLFTAIITQVREITGNSSNEFAGMTDEDFSYAMSELSQIDAKNSKWILGKKPMHYIRTLKDNNGNNIFVSPSAPSVPATIYGYPISYWNNADVSDAADTTFGVFGDLKQFYVAERLGTMTIDSDPYNDFAGYTTRFRMVTRWALGLRRAGAFIRIKTTA